MPNLIQRLASAWRGDAAPAPIPLDTMAERLDGWYSAQLGMGGLRDKATMMAFVGSGRLSSQAKNDLWRGSGLIQKIINLPTDNALRAGIDMRHKRAEDLQDAIRREDFDLWAMVSKGMKLADAQGGSVTLLDVHDGQKDLTQPVNEKRVKWVKAWFQEPIPKQYAEPTEYTQEYISDVYRIQFSSGGTTYMHRSRLLIFDGIYAGPWNRYTNQGWGESIIDIIYEPLRNFESDHGAASTLVKDFSQSVLKMAGFDNSTRSNSSAAVAGAKERMKAMEILRSVVNAIIIDANEEFQRYSTTVTGLPDLIEIGKSYVAAVTNIPRTLLFGEQPNASIGGAAGTSVRQDWHDTVSDRQEQRIRAQLAKAIRYKALELGINDPVPFIFKSLVQPTALEMADRRLKTSQADAIDIDKGILTASQVAVSRYGSGEYSDQVVVSDAVIAHWRIEAEETASEQKARKAQEVMEQMQQQAALSPPQDDKEAGDKGESDKQKPPPFTKTQP